MSDENGKRSGVLRVAYKDMPVDFELSEKSVGQIEQFIDGLLSRGWTPPMARGWTPPTQATPSTAATAIPVCPYHGPMKESTIKGKEGTYYCSKKMADGSYCKEKG